MIETIDLRTLEQHPANPRVGDIEAIRESIENHDWMGVVVAQRSTRRILVGWHRSRAAIAADQPHQPVEWLDVDDNLALRIVLADNRASDLSTYDDRLLAELLLRHEDELERTLWTDTDLDILLASVGDVAGAAMRSNEAMPVEDMRSIIIVMPADRYAQALSDLADVRQREGVDSNAAAIVALVDTAIGSIG